MLASCLLYRVNTPLRQSRSRFPLQQQTDKCAAVAKTSRSAAREAIYRKLRMAADGLGVDWRGGGAATVYRRAPTA